MSERSSSEIGVVVIARNEGDRLRRCLRSLSGERDRIVYVDSGSTDGSVEHARSCGVDVVELDSSEPFTMARGRNAGLAHLAGSTDTLRFVQFVDGDCEVMPGWIETAAAFLRSHSDVAAVSGRRRERYPGHSAYNRLIDMEWDAPVGETAACGGDAMIRADALHQVGGYDTSMIAGEEPELCCRLRLAGWRIWRVETPMTTHDAALHSFGQWWRRTVRAGHAYAEGAWLHGRSSLRFNVREVRSIVLFGAALPLGSSSALLVGWLLGSLGVMTFGALPLLAYPALWVRVYGGGLARGRSPGDAALYAAACVGGKLPNAIGCVRFVRNRHRVRTLIEYKASPRALSTTSRGSVDGGRCT